MRCREICYEFKFLYLCECFVVFVIVIEIEIVILKSFWCYFRIYIVIEFLFKDCYFCLGVFSFRGS